MRHIRKFNENYESKNYEILDDVKADVNSYLSYLLDGNDFKYDARIGGSLDDLFVEITIGKLEKSLDFKFSDIKDDLIPFCQILSNKHDNITFKTRYSMSAKSNKRMNNTGFKVSYGSDIIKIKDIIEDKVIDADILNFIIRIKVNNKPTFIQQKKQTLLDKFKGIFK